MYVVALFCILLTTSGCMDVALAFSLGLNVVDNYIENVQFIKNIMIQDRLWLPILKEKIKMESLPRRHLDHFNKKPLSGKSETQMIVIDPFKEIVNLLMSKSMVGSEVHFVMATIHRAITCSITKHVSMQGFLLHQLILADSKSDILPYIIKWQEQIVRMSIDKLVAVNQKLPVMAKMYVHIINLLEPDVDLANNELNIMSQEMLREADAVCATSDGHGHYNSLIMELKKSMTIKELKALEFLMHEEHLKGLTELNDIKEIIEYHGSLTIANDTDPTGFSSLDKAELKKILTVNRIKMNYLYLNLPIKSLAMSQLQNIFNFQKMPVKLDKEQSDINTLTS